MTIKTSNSEIEVKAIIGQTMKRGAHSYPALKIVVPAGITPEDVNALLEGSFTIVETDEEGNVNEYIHEGYNTIDEISIVIAQVVEADKQIENLESQLISIRSEMDMTKNELDIAKNEMESAKNQYDAAKIELEAIKNELADMQTINSTYREEIETLEAENAKLLFNNLTNSNLPSESIE